MTVALGNVVQSAASAPGVAAEPREHGQGRERCAVQVDADMRVQKWTEPRPLKSEGVTRGLRDRASPGGSAWPSSGSDCACCAVRGRTAQAR
jgi:hypothetical protein